MIRLVRAVPSRGGARAALLTVTLLALVVVFFPPATAAPATQEHTFLADLSPEVRAVLEESAKEQPLPEEPAALLERVFGAATAYRFQGGPFTLRTDRRWFATEPDGGAASPALVVRRWPGDTVLALYLLRGEAPLGEQAQSIPDASLEPRPSPMPGSWRWEGTLDTPFGPRPVLWIEQRNAGSPTRTGALALPGDAGLGFPARWDLTEELLAVLARLEFDAEAADPRQGLGPSDPVSVPRLSAGVGEGSERADPWQVADGKGFTLGIPPGLRARRLDLGIDPPIPIRGGLLWLRGRFVDTSGEHVLVGDGERAGYVAEIGSAEGWSGGDSAPLGAPDARRMARESFHSMDSRPTGAEIWAERWREPGFEGEWLVFRLLSPNRNIEVGLPVIAGRKSASLFWIPLTWRGPGQTPAEPPVDPADRFGINFERFTKGARRRHPWGEGFLRVPGLRLELPKDWWPASTLRSENGFPVRLVTGEGRTAGQLRLLGKEDPRLEPQEGETWKPVPRSNTYRAAAAWERRDGARLLVTQEGYGFLIEPEPLPELDPTTWRRMVESALVVLPRP